MGGPVRPNGRKEHNHSESGARELAVDAQQPFAGPGQRVDRGVVEHPALDGIAERPPQFARQEDRAHARDHRNAEDGNQANSDRNRNGHGYRRPKEPQHPGIVRPNLQAQKQTHEIRDERADEVRKVEPENVRLLYKRLQDADPLVKRADQVSRSYGDEQELGGYSPP